MSKEVLDKETVAAYIEGTLDSKTMHRLERAAMDDPFLAEALEGLAHSKKPTDELNLLQKQLQQRIAENDHKKKVWGLTWQRLSIAASAAVLFVSAGVLFMMKEQRNNHIAANQPKTVEVNADSALTEQLNKDRLARHKDTVTANPNTTLGASAVQSGDKLASSNGAGNKNVERRAIVESSDKVAYSPRRTIVQAAPGIARTARAVQAEKATPDRKMLDEVVVTGYAAAPKNQTTYSVTTVRGVDTAHHPVANNIGKAPIGESLAGRVAGVSVARANVDAKKRAFTDTTTVLSEVVVVTTRKSKNVQVADTVRRHYAEPLLGEKSYNEYIKSHKRTPNDASPKSGRVIIEFFVNPNGTLTNFKVLKSLGQSYDEEAIRLIKEGPAWKPAIESQNSTVRFKIRF